MFRNVSIVFLALAAFVVTPVEAQRFRRYAPSTQQRAVSQQANYNRAYQQTLVRPQPAPAPRTAQASAAQTQPNCTCRQSQLTQQQYYARQAQANAAQVAAQTQAARTQAAQTQAAQMQAARTARPQRYGVYYNPRTNQTYTRPIQTAAPTAQKSNLNPINNRRTARQAQALAQQKAATARQRLATERAKQATDVAPQAATTARGVTPVRVAQPVVSGNPIAQPTLNAPVGTLTTLPLSPAAPVAQSAPAAQLISPAPVAEPAVASAPGVNAPTPASNSFSVLNTEASQPRTEPTPAEPTPAEPVKDAEPTSDLDETGK